MTIIKKASAFAVPEAQLPVSIILYGESFLGSVQEGAEAEGAFARSNIPTKSAANSNQAWQHCQALSYILETSARVLLQDYAADA